MPHRKRSTAAAIAGAAVRAEVLAAYEETHWNTTHAADLLGVCRRTLLRWAKKYRLRPIIDKARKAQASQ